MSNPNLANITQIYGKTLANVITTSPTVLVSNAADSNNLIKLSTLIISNVDGVVAADVTIDFFRSSVARKIVNTVSITPDSALTVIDKNSYIYLEEGDAIRVTSSASGNLEAICSYEILS